MTCDEVRAYAAAFATDSLTADERAAVLEHLETCPEAHEEFANMRAAAFMIARAAPEREPPSGLRARILETARSEPRDAARFSVLDRAQPLRWLAAAAAVALLFALGFTAGSLLRSNASSDLSLHVYNAESGAWLDVESAAGATEITLGGLPALDESAAYQVWVIRSGAPESVAVFEANGSGPWTTSVSLDLDRGERLAVTVSPSGGVPAPVGDLLLASGA
jgi:anti-sigma-K factor RskA